MNHEMANNRISQLPMAMAGIVHAFPYNGRSLSIFNYTVMNYREKTPTLTRSAVADIL
ncbi:MULTISPECIES: RAxF-45 family protein [Paenibacillus]|uniref:RAxF-45 family protein n=1 Tax=Paenibacillus TaxID=44249 RepID=UPI0003A6F753|nr:RAxF-45 family protein [Paenibacillus massiliensis]